MADRDIEATADQAAPATQTFTIQAQGTVTPPPDNDEE